MSHYYPGGGMTSDIVFKRWILWPVAAGFVVLGGMYFMRGEWFGGAFSIAVTVSLGMIARALAAPVMIRQEPAREDQKIALEGEGFSEAESQVLTKGLVYSELALIVAIIVLTLYSVSDRWWIVGIAGISVAVLFPKVSLFVVVHVQRMVSAGKEIGRSLLPPAIDCPRCSANMLLDDDERATKYFVCPGCSPEIDLR